MEAGTRFSERGFHRWIARFFRGAQRGRLPLGDDVAALPIGGRRVALLTTDALVEWTHFLPASPPEAIGAAAAGASLSDLASKGGRPVALLIDLLVTAETEERWARAVLRGADRAMQRFGGALVGGDTKSSRTPTVVGTALGIGRSDRLAPRSGARPGDLLAVTGKVGRGGAAYRAFTERGPLDRSALLGLLRIEPRVPEGAQLVRFAHALMDTSDGLGDSARLLSESSGVRVEIDPDSLPLAPGLGPSGDHPLPPTALFGGDYELFAALPPSRLEAATAAVRAAGGRLTVVGRVGRGRGAWLRAAGGPVPMPSAGWRSFG